MPLQESLHALEIGKGKKWIQLSTILAGYIALTLLYFVTQFHGFSSKEAMDCAQLARQLSRGEGYTTKFVRPSVLAQLGAQNPDVKVDPMKLPEIMQAPLYPYALSTVFKLAGTDFEIEPGKMSQDMAFPPERPIVVFNLLCLFLTGFVLYILALRLFDERVAFVATAAYVGCDLMWQFALSGISTSLVMLFITTLLLCLNEALRAQEDERGTAILGWCALAAICLVAAILGRLTLLWLIPPFLVFVFYNFRHHLLAPLAAVVVLVVGVTPWLYRNYTVSGSLLGGGLTLALEDKAGKMSTERSFSYSAEELWAKTGQRKIIFGGRDIFMRSFELLGASAIMLMFGVSLMHPFKRSRARWLRIFLVVGSIFVVVGSCLVSSRIDPLDDLNNLALLWPGFAIFGAAYFYVLLERLDLQYLIARYAIIGLFLIVCALPMIVTIMPPRPAPYQYPPYFPPMIRTVSQMIKPDEIIMSDMPWATAWYGDRVSLWLPHDLKEFYAINDSLHTISGLLLTPISWQWSLMEIDRGEADWAPMIRRQSLPRGFPLAAYTALPPNRNEYTFFSDRMRWRDEK
jgi:hypothetical protein